MGILDLNFPTLISKIPQNSNNSKFLYPMLLGVIFAIAGTPCSTPILAGIMGFAAISSSIFLSILMLFAFALGQGVILVVAGLFTNLIKNFGNVARVSEIMIKLSGLLGGSILVYVLQSFLKIYRINLPKSPKHVIIEKRKTFGKIYAWVSV